MPTAPDDSGGGETPFDMNGLTAYLQFLGLHPQGAQVPSVLPTAKGGTGGYWNQPGGGPWQQAAPAQVQQQPAMVGSAPMGGVVDYSRVGLPPVGGMQGKMGPTSMAGGAMGGGGGGGGGGAAGGVMGAMTGGAGGSSMMDIAKLAMMFL